MKKISGTILFLLLAFIGLSEVIFLNNGKIVNGNITSINSGIVILEVNDYKHMFPFSSLKYIFFSDNLELKKGLYLKNGIIIHKDLDLLDINEKNLILGNNNSKFIIKKDDVIQISFNNSFDKNYIKIKDTLFDFENIKSENTEVHSFISKNGIIRVNFEDLSKFSRNNKKYVLYKNNNIFFIKDYSLNKKGIKPYKNDDFYINDFNSFSKINISDDFSYDFSKTLYRIKTINGSFDEKNLSFGDDHIIVDNKEIHKNNLISINKNVIFNRDIKFFTSGENGKNFYLLDEDGFIMSLSENGTIKKTNIIKDFKKDHSIYSIEGNENYIFIRNEHSLIVLNANTLETIKRLDFNYIFSYKLTDKSFIIYSSFNPNIYIYSIDDLTLQKAYKFSQNVKDIEVVNDDLYIIDSTFLHKYVNGSFKVIENLGEKLYHLFNIDNTLYLLSYDSVFIYDSGDFTEIHLDNIYGYIYNGNKLYIRLKNKLYCITGKGVDWNIDFKTKSGKSSLTIADNYLYTIYGDNLYRISEDGKYEIIYKNKFDDDFNNLYILKKNYLLITSTDKVIEIKIPE